MTALAQSERRQPTVLAARAEAIMARELLAEMIRREFPGRIALVSSFGIEAAVLLHMVSTIDAGTPVIFLDTGKLFGETLRYRDQLVRRLGLVDVRCVQPDASRLAAEAPAGTLWQSEPDRCCAIRKVEPLERALSSFEAWINGRKRHHGGARAALPVVEAAGGRIKINPLASWGPAEIEAYFAAHELPRHPLEADGYRSVGCLPCSDRSTPGEEVRAGRWRGRGKTECGIHGAAAAPRDE